MTTSLSALKPAVAASMAAWHGMVANRNLDDLLSIVHPDAVFRSPLSNSPYRSAAAVALALGTVIQVFENFTYHRELASEDGLNVVLEFSANVGDRQLKGIDLVRFDEDGKIVEFEVMVRPLSGLQALGLEMGWRLGDRMGAFR